MMSLPGARAKKKSFLECGVASSSQRQFFESTMESPRERIYNKRRHALHMAAASHPWGEVRSSWMD